MDALTGLAKLITDKNEQNARIEARIQTEAEDKINQERYGEGE